MRTSRLLPVLALAFVAVPAAHAVEKDFKALTRAIESQFNVKREEIPMLGLAKFMVRTASVGGVGTFELANFEGLEYSEDNAKKFAGVVARVLDDNWRPMVRVLSRKSDEYSSIWVRGDGGHFRIIIANLERREANLIELKVDADQLMAWLRDPEHAADRASESAEGRE